LMAWSSLLPSSVRHYAGLSDAETAERTDTPAPTVRWRLRAAAGLRRSAGAAARPRAY